VQHERSPWVVVHTHPHKEQVALDHLARQNFACYCPLVRKRIRHARRTRDVLRPLFPGYVFVEMAGDRGHWRPLLSTTGVRTLVRSGEEPSRLDARFIDALRAREIDGVIVTPASAYTVGQQIRISEGPLEGIVATILDLDEKERIVVLMDILNRPVRVRLDAAKISTR
jgi:transcriptional antiterminator RfaH